MERVAVIGAILLLGGGLFLATQGGGDDDTVQGLDLVVTSPDDGAILEGRSTEFAYALSADRELTHTLVINGEKYRQNTIEAGETSIFREDVTLPDAGEHRWTLRLTDPSTGEVVHEYDMRTIEVDEGVKDVSVDLEQPSNDAIVDDSTPVFEYTVSAPFDHTVDLFVGDRLVDSTRFRAGDQTYQVSDAIEEPGNHTWYLQVISTDQIVYETDPRTFSTTRAAETVEMREIGMVEGVDSIEVGEGVVMTATAAVREEMDYRLMLEDEVYKEGTVDGNRLWLYEPYEPEEPGKYSWHVELTDGNETFESETVTFDVQPSSE